MDNVLYRSDETDVYVDEDEWVFVFVLRGPINRASFIVPYQYCAAAFKEAEGKIRGIIGDFSGVTRFEDGALRAVYSQSLSVEVLAGPIIPPLAMIIANEVHAAFVRMASRANRTSDHTKIVYSLQEAYAFIAQYNREKDI
ncbi:hypothetical protein G4Y79_00290 [Phototrophicus methaneseepsis]|uniref:Uncharacterized protein n=1 Tax=Phototrophicus methaneseepsis TaxID=2710758 RepID=A0A7S8E9F6_9CHLR|nr:hypothetical protein [Phototrophicus methaneseepsis]QPC82848.1 hypothetical protein G4Y79_00290 [Phototrophicus methaneseepsis]